MALHSDFHTVVIGAGSGGLTVAVGLAKFGKQVALVERGPIGGDCTNVGCVPSKTLIHLVEETKVENPDEVLQAVRDKRNHLRDEETEWVHEIENVSVFHGTAKLTGETRVEVNLEDGDVKILEAKNIVLATGGKPRRLEVEGLPGERTLTNETLFEQPHSPEHLAIIGAGPIGLEMAFAFRKLGSRVSLINRGERVYSVGDPEISEVLDKSLREKCVEVYLNAEAKRYDEDAQTLYVDQDGQEITLEGVDRVLMAAGRTPNVEGLGLEATGLEYDEKKGIPAGPFGDTNVKSLFSIGDVNPASKYTHSANAEGRRLVRRLVLPWLPRFGKEPTYPSATFSDPEIATIGPSLAELHGRYHPDLIKTLHVELKDTDKGYTDGLEYGFVSIHAVRLTGRILAASIVAPKASEMITLLTLCVYQGISLYKLGGVVFPYPTLSEGIKKAADNFTFETLPKLPQELRAYVRTRFATPKDRNS